MVKAKPLSESGKALLRTLVLGGELPWAALTTIQRKSFKDELEPRGYVQRSGHRGMGKAMPTGRGTLKALADGLIDCHPEDDEPLGRRIEAKRLWEHPQA